MKIQLLFTKTATDVQGRHVLCFPNIKFSMENAQRAESRDRKKSLTNIFGCEGVITQNIFEELCVDDSFDVGDAFIFNKFVNINYGDKLRESEFCGVII